MIDDAVSPDEILMKIKLSNLKQISQVHIEIIESVVTMGGEAKYQQIRDDCDVHSSNLSKRAKFLEELGICKRVPDEGEAGKSLRVNPDNYQETN